MAVNSRRPQGIFVPAGIFFHKENRGNQAKKTGCAEGRKGKNGDFLR
jgi:hypothetical protein